MGGGWWLSCLSFSPLFFFFFPSFFSFRLLLFSSVSLVCCLFSSPLLFHFFSFLSVPFLSFLLYLLFPVVLFPPFLFSFSFPSLFFLSPSYLSFCLSCFLVSSPTPTSHPPNFLPSQCSMEKMLPVHFTDSFKTLRISRQTYPSNEL